MTARIIQFPQRTKPASMERRRWPETEGSPPKRVQVAWDAVSIVNELGLITGRLDDPDFQKVREYIHGIFEDEFIPWSGGAA